MADDPHRIIQLPEKVRACIRSTTQILSLNDVILELVKNSLDANATQIEVHLDLIKGFCSVLDNGHGIPAEEFMEIGGLARPYCTSKSNELHSYGRSGSFLASLSAISILSISSSYKQSNLVYTLVLKDANRIAVQETTDFDTKLEGRKIGTKVVVHNLFGKLPVRMKHQRQRYERQKELEKDFHRLKIDVAALLIASENGFSIDITEETIEQRFSYRLPRTAGDSMLERVGSVMAQCRLTSALDHSTWEFASAESKSLSISAVICLRPMPTRNLQFISLGQIPVKSTAQLLYTKINDLFEWSDFGGIVDKWPAFYIRLETSSFDTEQSVAAVGDLITEFLRTHDFLTKPRKAKLSKTQPITPSRVRPSPFDVWSRIKSTKNVDHEDLVSGLPFFKVSVGPVRSSATSRINARTGMALPSQNMVRTSCRSLRNITETANILREKWSTSTDFEEWIRQGLESACTSISKNDLHSVRVIGQLDKKFILGVVGDLIVVIDQHAADERIKVEQYFSQLGHEHKLTLPAPIRFEVESHEVGLCKTAQPYLSSWGIEFVVKHEADFKAMICMTALPELIAERCRQHPQKMIDMVRVEIWKESQRCFDAKQDWLSNIMHCPQGILDMLVSRACRSAIMFNDVLTVAQAECLVRELSKCQFPFQCAHGRPSMNLLTLESDTQEENGGDFAQGWGAWVQ